MLFCIVCCFVLYVVCIVCCFVLFLCFVLFVVLIYCFEFGKLDFEILLAALEDVINRFFF